MKFICDKKELAAALKIATRALGTGKTNPMLECVLIKAKNENTVELVCNDMELAISTKLAANVMTPGEIAIEGKLLSDIANKSYNGEVQFETNENLTATIKSGKAKFAIPGKPADDFTDIPEKQSGIDITVPTEDFCYAIDRTVFCAAPQNNSESNRNSIIMVGECINVSSDEMTITALDGHRIGMRKLKLNAVMNYPDLEVIIPGKTLREICKIATGDEMIISFEKMNVIFTFGDTVVVSRTIEGKYFDISKIMRNDSTIKVEVDKKEFIDTVDRTTVLIRKDEKKPLVVTLNDDTMTFDVTTSYGTTSEDIGIYKTGGDLRIGFNPSFLIAAANAIDEEYITMELLSPKAPVFFKDDYGTYMYVVLPVNINN